MKRPTKPKIPKKPDRNPETVVIYDGSSTWESLSLAELLDLIPANVTHDKVEISCRGYYDDGYVYVTYTKEISDVEFKVQMEKYQDELVQYDQKIEQYEKELLEYRKFHEQKTSINLKRKKEIQDQISRLQKELDKI